MDGGGFIRELCIALKHRWIPECWFLLFTAYFDEADTHGETPTIIMAGFLGTARQWQLFERRLTALQRRDRFNIFHVTEFKHRSGEFRGWSEGKRARLIDDLTGLVRDNLTEGLTIHLEHARYIAEYTSLPFPRKMPRDTQYGLCFRACLRRLVDIVLADGKKHRLHVVIERGHRHAGDAVRIFDDTKERLKTRRGIDLLGDFTLARKAERAPLMVGDFLAGTFSMMRATAAAGGVDYKIETQNIPIRKRDAGLTFLEFQPGSLQQLKIDWEVDRKERTEAWQTRRQAKSSSSPSGPETTAAAAGEPPC
jgi:hypothetical protein